MGLVDVVKEKSKRFLLWNKTFLETEIIFLSDDYQSIIDVGTGLTLGYNYFQAKMSGEEKYKCFLEGFIAADNPKTNTAKQYLAKLKQ